MTGSSLAIAGHKCPGVAKNFEKKVDVSKSLTAPVIITWTDRVIPSVTWIISLGISASLFSNIWYSVLMSSRMKYLAIQEGQLSLLFNMLNIHSSPLIAVLVIVIMASLMIASTSLIELINYLFFFLVFSFWSLLLIAGLIKLRYQEPNLPRPYKVSLPVLLVTVAINLCLVLIPLMKSPKMHYVYIVFFIFSGLVFYIPLIYFNLKLVWFEKITYYLQLLCNICLPDESDEQITEHAVLAHECNVFTYVSEDTDQCDKTLPTVPHYLTWVRVGVNSDKGENDYDSQLMLKANKIFQTLEKVKNGSAQEVGKGEEQHDGES
ncbi:LOW QUALITY PROTEIN: solute carrier family 7 member 13-like [Dugong dugon]